MKAENRDPIVKEVIKAGGGGAELARKLNLQRQAVYQWDQIPPQHVLKVEEITGVSRHRQRPDLYGPAPAEGSAA